MFMLTLFHMFTKNQSVQIKALYVCINYEVDNILFVFVPNHQVHYILQRPCKQSLSGKNINRQFAHIL